jgi:hypothetical protein
MMTMMNEGHAHLYYVRYLFGEKHPGVSFPVKQTEELLGFVVDVLGKEIRLSIVLNHYIYF